MPKNRNSLHSPASSSASSADRPLPKKVAFFVAHEHHARFIVPIADALRAQGAEVIFFTTLSEYPYEMWLVKQGYPFRFLYEYGNPTIKQKVNRALVDMLPQWLELYYSWNGMQTVSMWSVEKFLARSIEEYLLTEAFLSQEQPELLVALHEVNPWGKTMGYLSHRYGIPFVTLQEGEYYIDFVQLAMHAEYSTVDMLWGPSTRRILESHGCPSEKLVEVGNTHIEAKLHETADISGIMATSRELGLKSGLPVVVIFLDGEWGLLLDQEFWARVFKGFPFQLCQVVFKAHPLLVFSDFETRLKPAMEKVLPGAKVLFWFDSYRLLAVADHVVIVGKSTIAVEAIAYGKPLYSTPSLKGNENRYGDLGVSQPVAVGEWAALESALRDGYPQHVLQQAKDYLSDFFPFDNRAIERCLDVVSHIVATRAGAAPVAALAPLQNPGDRPLSVIIPVGEDVLALPYVFAALADLALPVGCEVLLAGTEQMLASLGDYASDEIRLVKSESGGLAARFNVAISASRGKMLLFLSPDTAPLDLDGLLDAAGNAAIAGMKLVDEEGKLLALGASFEFSHAPRPRLDEKEPLEAISQGGLAVPRDLIGKLGGFDERIADGLIMADYSLTAVAAGCGMRLADEAMAVRFGKSEANPRAAQNAWRGNVAFFAKWHGKLPKNENILDIAAPLLLKIREERRQRGLEG